jgi:hypothetical protein
VVVKIEAKPATENVTREMSCEDISSSNSVHIFTTEVTNEIKF